MEYFMKTKYVRLKSLRNRYLVAGKDGESVKQSRNGNAIRACWIVEMVEGRPNLIRLRSCHGKFLTASDDRFILGWTGDKVFQTSGSGDEPSVHWEPVSVSDLPSYIRLRSPVYGKYLRANGGAPPWRKSVTVDVQESAVTQVWVLWCVDTLTDQGIDSELCSSGHESDQSTGASSPASSSSPLNLPLKSGILDLHNAKIIRLLSHHNKYLWAHEDGDLVIQDKHGSQKQAYWAVEHISPVKGGSLVRLKSNYQKYLTATEDNFLLGATGKKVKQTVPAKLDYSIEWELIRDGNKVRLKTWDGNFLRANGGVPPWRNSVTHDLPHLSKDKLLWGIEVFDVYDD
ncbi:hypothetical protein KSS87_022736 [Heliosperma pusillum]|nr:hypothetical protein KSS87_022736 [Heliosperma pusillum]